MNKVRSAKILLSAAALAAIAGIVPNSLLVFGYGNGGGGGGGGGNNTAGTPPVCGDVEPGSAPTLLSAVPVGNNQIQLTWSPAADPVTYYLISFGTRPGQELYGNPNVGGPATTRFTVDRLPGANRYYFHVRAGNGCRPGHYSNELSAVTSGAPLGGLPAGFLPGVLGAQTQQGTVLGATAPTPTIGAVTPTVAPTTAPVTPTPTPLHEDLLSRILDFFRHLIRR